MTRNICSRPTTIYISSLNIPKPYIYFSLSTRNGILITLLRIPVSLFIRPVLSRIYYNLVPIIFASQFQINKQFYGQKSLFVKLISTNSIGEPSVNIPLNFADFEIFCFRRSCFTSCRETLDFIEMVSTDLFL